jgi:hypothetical protein
MVVDPNVFTSSWDDRWLQKYATALIKQQWGSNLTKFTGTTIAKNKYHSRGTHWSR